MQVTKLNFVNHNQNHIWYLTIPLKKYKYNDAHSIAQNRAQYNSNCSPQKKR